MRVVTFSQYHGWEMRYFMAVGNFPVSITCMDRGVFSVQKMLNCRTNEMYLTLYFLEGCLEGCVWQLLVWLSLLGKLK